MYESIANKSWYDYDKYSDQLPGCVNSTLQKFDQWRRNRILNNSAAAWAYERDRFLNNQRNISSGPSTGSAPEEILQHFDWLDEDTPPSVNIVKSTVDTMSAWLFSNRLRVQIGTHGAHFEQRRSIEWRSRALDAIYNNPKTAQQIRLALRDGALKGCSFARPIFRRGQIEIKRLNFYQTYFDPYDARDGDPTWCAYYDYIDRRELISWVKALNPPDLKYRLKAIKNIKSPQRANTTSGGSNETLYLSPYDYELKTQNVENSADKVKVVYCYRAATTPDANDGRVTILALGEIQRQYDNEGVVLFDSEFNRTTLPLVVFSPYPTDEGIDGVGMFSLMRPWQRAIDKSFAKIQNALDKYGHLRILAAPGAFKNLEEFAARGITIIEVNSGNDVPQILDPQVIRTEDLQWIDRCLTLSGSFYGITQMMRHGGSELGAGASAVALVEEEFRGKDRFSDVTEQVDKFELSLARECLNAIDDALSYNSDFRASFLDKYGVLRSVKWKDLLSQNSEYEINLEPTSELGRSRSGRLAKAIDYTERGLLDPSIAKELLMSQPDIARAAELEMAAIKVVEMQLDELTNEDGDWDKIRPDKDLDLNVALSRVKQYISLAKLKSAKEETMNRLRAYKMAVEGLQVSSQEPPQEIGPGPDTAGPSPEQLAGLMQAQTI